MPTETRQYIRTKDIEPFPDDIGCKYFPSCLKCPFPACYEDLKIPVATRRLFEKRDRILAVYKWIDKGMTQKDISKTFDIPLGTIAYWQKKRKRIEQLFNDNKRLLNYIYKYGVKQKCY